MRRHVADVQEERLFDGDGFLEKGDGMVVEGIGHEEIVGEFPRLVVEVEIVLHDGMPIADHALAVGPEETVESAFDREVATLPLANHGGVVAATSCSNSGMSTHFEKSFGWFQWLPRWPVCWQ